MKEWGWGVNISPHQLREREELRRRRAAQQPQAPVPGMPRGAASARSAGPVPLLAINVPSVPGELNRPASYTDTSEAPTRWGGTPRALTPPQDPMGPPAPPKPGLGQRVLGAVGRLGASAMAGRAGVNTDLVQRGAPGAAAPIPAHNPNQPATVQPLGQTPAAGGAGLSPVSDYDMRRRMRELETLRQRTLHQMTQTPRGERGGLVEQRHSQEGELRDLYAATRPAPRVQSVEEIERSRERLFRQIPAARAAYDASAPVVAPQADAALAAGEQMVRGTPLARPGMSPQTEAMRRDTLRFAAGAPEMPAPGGTGLTSPADREMRARAMREQEVLRQRAAASQLPSSPSEVFEGTAAEVRAGQERGAARAEADRAAALPYAQDAVRRAREQEELRRRAERAPVEAATSTLEAQTAANEEAADPRIRAVERQARLDMMRAQAAQQAGARATAQRSSAMSVAGIDDPDAFSREITAGATGLRGTMTPPAGSLLTSLGQDENGVVWQPNIDGAQNFINTAVGPLERLAQYDPATASRLAADALLAMPEANAGGEYTVAGRILQPFQSGEDYQSKQATARLLTSARQRLQSLAAGGQPSASR